MKLSEVFSALEEGRTVIEYTLGRNSSYRLYKIIPIESGIKKLLWWWNDKPNDNIGGYYSRGCIRNAG